MFVKDDKAVTINLNVLKLGCFLSLSSQASEVTPSLHEMVLHPFINTLKRHHRHFPSCSCYRFLNKFYGSYSYPYVYTQHEFEGTITPMAAEIELQFS